MSEEKLINKKKIQKYGTEDETTTRGVNFEDAITATNFGKFNILLLLASMPARMSSLFETTTMSYVFPTAQCDLDLSLEKKGLLNGITYLGMMSSAFVWGYLSDSFGRRKLLVIGFFLDACFVMMSALSQTFHVLLLSKFLGGFIVNGPYAALTCYLSEFHSAKYRARVQMILGFFSSLGSIILPIMAGIVLPSDINFVLFGYFNLHSWNVYLFLTMIPSFFGACLFLFLPESPKFLMSSGQNDKAMKVFQMVYRLNTGKPIETYPVKSLVHEKIQRNEQHNNCRRVLIDGIKQLKPLFFPPLLMRIILVCVLQMLLMMSINTLKLWLPQLFQAINDYKSNNGGKSAPLCTMLDVFKPKNTTFSIPEVCVVNRNNFEVYQNTIIVSTVTIIGFVLAGSLINFLGKKKLLFSLTMIAGICGLGLYFSETIYETLALTSLFIALGSICVNVILSVVVDLFPTTLRTMTISMTMMVGRAGAMSGNLLFPFLLKKGCGPPFLTIGFGMMSFALISILLPNTDMKALQ